MANQVLYGFNSLKDLALDRVTDSMVPVISDAIRQALAEHNRQMQAAFSLFVQPTTLYTERYLQTGLAKLQSLDDNGRALPIKTSGYYDVAYPLEAGGTAWGANDVTRAKMTVAEVARIVDQLTMADIRWVRDHILGALFMDSTWTFSDDLHGSLTVQPLASGDSVTYQIISGNDAGATDTHQLADSNAIADAHNPFPTIYTELMEHPENGGQCIAFISSSLKATTEALATFNPVADPNIRAGSATDVLVGSLSVPVPGTLIGYEDSGCWIVEWPFLPSGYIIGVTTDGARPLAMREDPEPELQGFKMVAERQDHPFWEAQYRRRAGFGARNRVGAVAMLIGNASYSVPTGYTPPLS